MDWFVVNSTLQWESLNNQLVSFARAFILISLYVSSLISCIVLFTPHFLLSVCQCPFSLFYSTSVSLFCFAIAPSGFWSVFLGSEFWVSAA